MLSSPSVLERLLRPSVGDVPVDYARRLLELDFSTVDHARYLKLSEKSQLGGLSADEQVELDDLLTANELLMILRAKAERSLRSPSAE